MRKRLFFPGAAGLLALAIVLWITAPQGLDENTIGSRRGDAKNGAVVFSAAGCASCHGGRDKPQIPSGGVALKTPVGDFTPPNLTSDSQTGLGGWTALEFANAVMRGISPSGQHYYPAFPYVSYQNMRLHDVLDMWAHLKTLDPVANTTAPSPFPFDRLARRFVGIWKYFALDPSGAGLPEKAEQGDAVLARGRYLVTSLGRCGECHTPRNLLFVMKKTRFLKGGPHPEGTGKVPDITSTGRLGKWTVRDIVSTLETGMLPDFSDDISSGGMEKVLKGLKALPKEDLRAIASYLKTLP